MIGYFPPPHNDELVNSILTRLDGMFEFPNMKSIGATVFKRTTATAIVDCPTYLDTLVAMLPTEMGITSDDLIDNHTLWPYYAAFRSKQSREISRLEMQRSGHPYLRLGLMASRSAWPRYLRYCPTCVDQDREKFYETFWHRAHQLPGIEVCCRHAVVLQNSLVPYRHNRNRHAYPSAETSIVESHLFAEPARKEELVLARGAEWLLSNPKVYIDIGGLRLKYQARLADLGYASRSGRLNCEALKIAFAKAYAPEWLVRIGCSLSPGEPFWVADLVRSSPRSRQTLRHLLFMNFLGLDVDKVFDWEKQPHSFGKAPWPCLNTASQHYGALAVQKCIVKPIGNGRRVAGWFECPECGFIYVRYGPDNKDTDRMHRDHIPCYGNLWDGHLKKLWSNSSVSLRSLSDELGVDPTTVKLQAARLGLPSLRPGNRGGAVVSFSPLSAEGPRGNSEAYKADWMSIRSQLPIASRSELRRLRPATYMFLWRHARSWLELNSPPSARERSHGLIIDWKSRDQEMEVEVRMAAEMLRAWIPPVHLTRTAILREARCLWVPKRNVDLLKLTNVALAELTETRPEFAVRRISCVVEDCRASSRLIPLWKIARTAGLRPDMMRDKAVQFALNRADLELNRLLGFIEAHPSNAAMQTEIDFAAERPRRDDDRTLACTLP
jgi:hypothetical protein